MSFFRLFVAPALIADIPPPPFSVPHSSGGWAFFVIFWGLCAAAFVGLRKLFRRRSKKSDPDPEPKPMTKE